MYKDKFVLSVLHDGSPVKETGRRSKKEIAIPFDSEYKVRLKNKNDRSCTARAIPFDSEYKVRLKNKNDRSCTARVFVDGRKVSQLGDFIIHAGGTADLERFVDRSLDSGKKFKFVPLDHEDVDDPTSSDNGIIKVEFRLAKVRNGMKMLRPKPWPSPPDDVRWDVTPNYEDNNGPKNVDWKFWDDNSTGGGLDYNTTRTVYYCNSDGLSNSGGEATLKKQKSVDAGATVEGGKSGQSFTYSDLEVDNSRVVTLMLKMVGINKERSMNKYKYCTNCGTKVNRRDNYCSECGYRSGNSA